MNQELMTSEECAKIIVENINLKVKQAIERVNIKLEQKIFIKGDLFQASWINAIKKGIDIVVANEILNGSIGKEEAKKTIEEFYNHTKF